MTTRVNIGRVLVPAIVLIAMTHTGCGVGSESARPVQQETPATTFEILDQYGVWFNLPVLGEVWRPREAYGWQPYIDGRWIWTDRGWMWAGYEPYSWVVYHYGYWTYDDVSGWVWVPSYDWSPSRVRWVTTDAYVGWAPMPPPGVTLVAPEQDTQWRVWTMVPAQSFVLDNVGRYKTRTAPLRPGTRPIGDTRGGPNVQEVGRLTNQNFNPIRLETERVRSGNRQLEKVKIPSNGRSLEQSSGDRPSPPTIVVPPAAQQPPAPQPVNPPAVQPGRNADRHIAPGETHVQPSTPAPTGVQGRQPGGRTDAKGDIRKLEKKEKPKETLPPKKGVKEKDKVKEKERKEER